jgi:acetyltransferase-like isoleucine patch superfamily enzyme
MNAGDFLRRAATLCDPRGYLHLLRMVRYYHYSHVVPRAALRLGADSGMAPTVSLRNGARITIGRGSHIGENCYLWAGDSTGCIFIGDHVSLAPGVFITASDYQFVAGVAFREQPKRERDVHIGNDVWLGAGVVVTAGVSVGDGSIVGAGAVVTRDLPAGCIAAGVPAKVIGERPSNPTPCNS